MHQAIRIPKTNPKTSLLTKKVTKTIKNIHKIKANHKITKPHSKITIQHFKTNLKAISIQIKFAPNLPTVQTAYESHNQNAFSKILVNPDTRYTTLASAHLYQATYLKIYKTTKFYKFCHSIILFS